MSETTEIDYVDHTWSPWRGCEKVSPGCQNCYAEALGKRVGLDAYGHGKPRIKTKDWKKPLRWDLKACEDFFGDKSPRVFPSLCDWLDDAVPIEWLADFLQLIYDTPNLTWLLLTKRPENLVDRLGFVDEWFIKNNQMPMAHKVAEWYDDLIPPENVWFGVTCENQEMADKRIPILLDIPAKVRWVSCEPMLTKIHFLTNHLIGSDPFGARMDAPNPKPKIDWIVAGGESGPHYRLIDMEWLAYLVARCRSYNVPLWIKQDCGRFPGQQGRIPDEYWKLKQLPHA